MSAASPKLIPLVRSRLRLRHMSLRTEQAYLDWIRRFVRYHGVRHPQEMGEVEVIDFLSDLAERRGVASSTQMQALSALLFLYREVLQRPVGDLRAVVRARSPSRLPVVLSREEVSRLLALLTGDVYLVALLLYGSGLRLMEALSLRVKMWISRGARLSLGVGRGLRIASPWYPRARWIFSGASSRSCGVCTCGTWREVAGAWRCPMRWRGRRHHGRLISRGSGCSPRGERHATHCGTRSRRTYWRMAMIFERPRSYLAIRM